MPPAESSRTARLVSIASFLLLALVLVSILTKGTVSAAPTVSALTSALVSAAPLSPSRPHVPNLPHVPDCGPDWEVVPSPNVGTDANHIYAIAVISVNDVWGVGDYRNASNIVQTLTIHWDGVAWSVVPSPNAGTHDNALYGVAAVSSTDIWAVGRYSSDSTGNYQTLVEHWNGNAWNVVSSPNMGPTNNFLYGVAAVSASDVWAVGIYSNETNATQTLTEHWNGSAWSIVPSPSPGATNFLNGVTAVSASDVWAVGFTGTDANQTLVLHWNGNAWSVATSPSPGTYRNFLYGVAAVSANDVWAVGYASSDVSSQTLIEHWNGTAWSVVTSPAPGRDNQLNAVAAFAASDVWAVGGYIDTSGNHTLVEHWNGTAWSVVSNPSPSSLSTLYGVAAVSANDVWAVGDYDNGFVAQTLVERYNPCLTTSTPQSTQTPGGPTATPVLPSNTPTTTPTFSSTPTATNSPTAGTPTSTSTSTLTPIATATQCSVQFEYVPSPNSGSGVNHLSGVAIISANDVWAVGYYFNGSAEQTLTEHWDGTAWNIVPGANNGSQANLLNSVAAVSATDVWAVGYYVSGSVKRTLIEHWDGTAWNIVFSPNSGLHENILNSVAVVSANDVWAVGSYFDGQTTDYALTEHWNGSAWSVVQGISGGDTQLYGVTAISANNVWAVGNYGAHTLTARWNGNGWLVVDSPSVGANANQLRGVSAISAHDVWAVGYYYNGSVRQTLTEHWNGTGWRIVASPNTGYDNQLNGVAVVSANDVWAVGYYDSAGFIDHALTEHWNGSSWSTVTTSSPDSNGDILYGVEARYAGDAWAVGGYVNSSMEQTLVERYHLCSTPSPTTVAGTPSPTPGTCLLQFIDVPEGSTFYPFVRCLACRGIVSGYPDNTFRPNNNVTRGQLSKIVSNAAGYSEPAGARLFEDVVPGSTFYEFVERLASRGYINGYLCGSVGEPCGGGNLPYFRPNNNATRGQISKIVSNAAGFSDPVGAQLFEDVELGSTFSDFIYRLAARSIINGYPCGGAGEPCDAGNRPYFRPNSNATRGQTSKIVANTFFPNCVTP
ncbi:MAG: S-layer homology domain-containing protein [Chloroflexota bacterium]